MESNIKYYTIEEMASLVEDYIYERKGVRVKIDLYNNLSIHGGRQFVLLNEAHNIALEWFNRKNEDTSD